jgi:AraC-like DNA-binding protein
MASLMICIARSLSGWLITRRFLTRRAAISATVIREWGWTVPVLIDEAGTIIAGHGSSDGTGHARLISSNVSEPSCNPTPAHSESKSFILLGGIGVGAVVGAFLLPALRTDLSCPPGIVDPTMAQLAAALLPAFARPHEAGEIFVDHVVLAVCAHLIQRYGGGVLPPVAITKGGLTPVQTLRAKDLLASRLKGDLRLAEVAKECGISRQHFIRAFKTTVGCTPYQWLQRQRVDLVARFNQFART